MRNFSTHPLPIHFKKERWPPCDGTPFWGCIAPSSFIGLEMEYVGIDFTPICQIDSVQTTSVVNFPEFSFEVVLSFTDDSSPPSLELVIQPESLFVEEEIWGISLEDYQPILLFEVSSDFIVSSMAFEQEIAIQSLSEEFFISNDSSFGIELYSVGDLSFVSDPTLIETAILKPETTNSECEIESELKFSSFGELTISLFETTAPTNVFGFISTDLEFVTIEQNDSFENDWRWWFLEINGPYE